MSSCSRHLPYCLVSPQLLVVLFPVPHRLLHSPKWTCGASSTAAPLRIDSSLLLYFHLHCSPLRNLSTLLQVLVALNCLYPSFSPLLHCLSTLLVVSYDGDLKCSIYSHELVYCCANYQSFPRSPLRLHYIYFCPVVDDVSSFPVYTHLTLVFVWNDGVVNCLVVDRPFPFLVCPFVLRDGVALLSVHTHPLFVSVVVVSKYDDVVFACSCSHLCLSPYGACSIFFCYPFFF